MFYAKKRLSRVISQLNAHGSVRAILGSMNSAPNDFSKSDLDLLAAILRELSADSGTVHAIGEDGALHLRAAIGIPEPVLAIVRLVPVGKGMAGLAAERRCAVNVCNIQQDTTGDVRVGARATGLSGSVAVPILDAVGVLHVVLGVATRAERTFTTDDERVIASRGLAFFPPLNEATSEHRR